MTTIRPRGKSTPASTSGSFTAHAHGVSEVDLAAADERPEPRVEPRKPGQVALTVSERHDLGLAHGDECTPDWCRCGLDGKVASAERVIAVRQTEALEGLRQEFRREADPSTTGVWREAADLLDRLVARRTRQAADAHGVADPVRGHGLLSVMRSQPELTHAYWSMRDNGPKRAHRDMADMIAAADTAADCRMLRRLLVALNTIPDKKRNDLRDTLDARAAALTNPNTITEETR